jgi:hypothetical protein
MRCGAISKNVSSLKGMSPLEEIALLRYRQRIVERLTEAIERIP